MLITKEDKKMFDNVSLKDIKTIAKVAGDEIMKIYQRDFEIEYKEDNSPLTEADIKANEIICNSLFSLYPDIPILSEENSIVEYKVRKKWDYYWCIDPIDGTKEFIKKNGEFTVNIALIHKDIPVLGVVYAPALDLMYGAKKGEGAYLNDRRLPLSVNENKKEKLVVLTSKSHLSSDTQNYIDSLDTKVVEQISKGSSLKLCMVADGSADIYPRLAPTMEWDTAAADAIVREAGKMSYDFKTNKPMRYNKQDLLNPWFVIK